jgi:hypothetical protein
MSDIKVIREGLPIEHLDKHSTPEQVGNAIGESARRLREEHGVRPLEAFEEARRRAKDRIKDIPDGGD